MAEVPIRVVIGEDHALVREGTGAILERQSDIAVVGEAGDGASAVELVVSLKPDVALLDIRMPGTGGIEATRQIREQCPDTAVLILTAHDDEEYVFAMLEAGVAGYLLKTIRGEELLDAVRRVDAGEVVLDPRIAQKVATLWAQHGKPRPAGDELTTREMDVLRLICRGLQNKEIARELSISIRTVEGHMEGIFNRLEVRSRTEAAMYATSRNWFPVDGASQ
ncbi:MAG: response regulator transcription factor [Dehalococcoidia bacterium]